MSSKNGLDAMDNKDLISNKQKQVPHKLLIHGEINGKVPIYLSDKRTVIYTDKTDPDDLDKIRNRYEKALRPDRNINDDPSNT